MWGKREKCPFSFCVTEKEEEEGVRKLLNSPNPDEMKSRKGGGCL